MSSMRYGVSHCRTLASNRPCHAAALSTTVVAHLIIANNHTLWYSLGLVCSFYPYWSYECHTLSSTIHDSHIACIHVPHPFPMSRFTPALTPSHIPTPLSLSSFSKPRKKLDVHCCRFVVHNAGTFLSFHFSSCLLVLYLAFTALLT